MRTLAFAQSRRGPQYQHTADGFGRSQVNLIDSGPKTQAEGTSRTHEYPTKIQPNAAVTSLNAESWVSPKSRYSPEFRAKIADSVTISLRSPQRNGWGFESLQGH